MKEVLAQSGVTRITSDQCQLGQETDKREPLRKPMGFMDNCEEVLAKLHRRCKGRGGACSRPRGGQHQHCRGKIARRAAICQRELCEAILAGLRDHLVNRRRLRPHEQLYTVVGLMMEDAEDDVRKYFNIVNDDHDHDQCMLGSAAAIG